MCGYHLIWIVQHISHLKERRFIQRNSYIQNQEQHHRRRSFKDEYLAWLKKFEIPFEEKYVFQFIE